MARVVIPLESSDAAYAFQVDLGASRYTFQLTWNTRGRFWTMDVLGKAGLPLLLGVRVIANSALLRTYQDPRLPDGLLFTVDMSEVGADPRRDDLGDRVVLVYDNS